MSSLRILKWFDPSRTTSLTSADSFQSLASTLANSGHEDRLQNGSAIVPNECNNVGSDVLSNHISDQMLLKQAFRESVLSKKAAAKDWLKDRTIAAAECNSKRHKTHETFDFGQAIAGFR